MTCGEEENLTNGVGVFLCPIIRVSPFRKLCERITKRSFFETTFLLAALTIINVLLAILQVSEVFDKKVSEEEQCARLAPRDSVKQGPKCL